MATATIGNLNIESGQSDTYNYMQVTQMTFPVAGAVTKISVYMRNSGATIQYVKGIIYDGGTLATAALLGVTTEYTMAANQAEGWVDLVFATPVSVSSGMKRVGLMTGGNTDCKYYYTGGSEVLEYVVRTYTSGPCDPFGAGGTQTTEKESIYATYTTGTVVTSGLVSEYVGKRAKGSGTFGYTGTGTGPGQNTWNEGFQVGKFTLGENGYVTKLTLRLQAYSDTIDFKGVIYAADGTAGIPGTLKGVTEHVGPLASNWDGQVDATFATPVYLTAGDYWIGWVNDHGYPYPYRTTGSGTGRMADATQADYDSPPVWSDLDTNYADTNRYDFYATYTTAAPGNNTDPTSTWNDNVGTADLSLVSGWAYTTASGWKGAGTAGDPYCLQFDEADSLVRVESSPITRAGTWSVETWFTIPAGGTAYQIIWAAYHGTDSDPEMRFALTDTGYLYFGAYDDAGTYSGTIWFGFDDLRGTGLHHTIITSDGTNVLLYWNGEYVDTDTLSGIGTTSLNRFALGSVRSTTWSRGTVVTCRVYSDVLTLGEVAQNYAAGVLAASTDISDRTCLIAFGIC